jgi:hypothetical protein
MRLYNLSDAIIQRRSGPGPALGGVQTLHTLQNL